MNRTRSGQALVEVCVFFLVIYPLLAGFVGFTHWVQVRLKVLQAARHAALLYSSGRFKKVEVENEVKQFLASGAPELDPAQAQIHLSRAIGHSFTPFDRVDRIRVSYRRSGGWQRWLRVDPVVEETFYVKHSPIYWAPGAGPVAGPAVSW